MMCMMNRNQNLSTFQPVHEDGSENAGPQHVQCIGLNAWQTTLIVEA
jgi:hypothetical protein